jgi:hypothetical protein
MLFGTNIIQINTETGEFWILGRIPATNIFNNPIAEFT